MLITDLLDPADLVVAVEGGYVRARRHPTEPLTIYNYAERAAVERAWNDVTRQCRGLIVRDDGTVVARPWPKFFNHGEPESAALMLDLDAPVEVTDKQDGSLGIFYPVSDGWAVATRGSFASDQALHATELLRLRYPDWTPPDGLTVLVEIVYPANRIVLDYGDQDHLVLLGAVDVETGSTLGPDGLDARAWPGPRTTVMGQRTLRYALAAPPRPNAEGLVVRLLDTDSLVKIKQQDYVELHRIVTGLNARVVWEHGYDYAEFTALLERLPDEFRRWATGIRDDLMSTCDRLTADAYQVFAALNERRLSRRDFAAEAQKHPTIRPWLFMLLDGRTIGESVWKTLRPSGQQVPRYLGKDVA